MICASGTNQCRVLRRDEMLPDFAALLTGRLEDRLRDGWVTSAADGVFDRRTEKSGRWAARIGNVRRFGHRPTSLERSKARPAATRGWKRRSRRGLRTGRRVQVADDQSAVNDELTAGRRTSMPTSPFFRKRADRDGGDVVDPPSSVESARPTEQRSAVFPSGMQNPCGAWRRRPGSCRRLAPWRRSTPTNAAVATNKAVSAILLSIGFPCGFVVCGFKPTRRIWRRISRNRREQPAHHGGNT